MMSTYYRDLGLSWAATGLLRICEAQHSMPTSAEKPSDHLKRCRCWRGRLQGASTRSAGATRSCAPAASPMTARSLRALKPSTHPQGTSPNRARCWTTKSCAPAASPRTTSARANMQPASGAPPEPAARQASTCLSPNLARSWRWCIRSCAAAASTIKTSLRTDLP